LRAKHANSNDVGANVESGKVTLSTNNKEALEVVAVNKRIDVNLKDNEFIKDLIASVRKGSENINIPETVKESPQMVKNGYEHARNAN